MNYMTKKSITKIEPITLPKPVKDDEVENNRFKVTEEEKVIIAKVNEVPPPKPIVEETTEDIVEGLVKVQVTHGTVSFEQGSFEKGETFEVTRERLSGLDQRFIKIV